MPRLIKADCQLAARTGANASLSGMEMRTAHGMPASPTVTGMMK